MTARRGHYHKACECYIAYGQKDHTCPGMAPKAPEPEKPKKDRRRGNYRPERAPVKPTGHQYGDYDKPISWPEEKT